MHACSDPCKDNDELREQIQAQTQMIERQKAQIKDLKNEGKALKNAKAMKAMKAK